MACTALALDLYREQYLRRLHRDGYPATQQQMVEFAIRFVDDLGLQGKEREQVRKAANRFGNRTIKRRTVPDFIKESPELTKILDDVVEDFLKKRTQAWKAAADKKRTRSRRTQAASPPRKEAPAKKEDTSPEVQQKEPDVSHYELQLMHCHLTIVQARAANESQAKQALEERNRSLEETNRYLEEKAVCLEYTVRSLEETVWEKDQMLKAAFKALDTFASIVSRPPAPPPPPPPPPPPNFSATILPPNLF